MFSSLREKVRKRRRSSADTPIEVGYAREHTQYGWQQLRLVLFELGQLILRQVLPGIVTGLMLAFGRGVGDAASVLFTAGYTDSLPTSLARPVASLPLAVFFQLGTPFPEVQQRAYASALVLTILILAISLGARWASARLARNVVK